MLYIYGMVSLLFSQTDVNVHDGTGAPSLVSAVCSRPYVLVWIRDNIDPVPGFLVEKSGKNKLYYVIKI